MSALPEAAANAQAMVTKAALAYGSLARADMALGKVYLGSQGEGHWKKNIWELLNENLMDFLHSLTKKNGERERCKSLRATKT